MKNKTLKLNLKENIIYLKKNIPKIEKNIFHICYSYSANADKITLKIS